MTNHFPNFSRFLLSLAAVFLLNGLNVTTQTAMGQAAVHDFVDLIGAGDAGVNAITDYVLFPYGPAAGDPGGFAIGDRGTGARPFAIVNSAPAGSLSIDTTGVGVGLNGISQHPTAQLHVAGGGPGDTFSQARILVENRRTTPGLSEMLNLTNNGGVGMRLVDNSTMAFFKIENVIGRFEIANGPVPFAIEGTAPGGMMVLGANGLGVGSNLPTSSLHVLADGGVSSPFLGSATITSEVRSPAPVQNRTMLNLVNNGGAFMTFTDTSQPGGSTWFFSNSGDELNLRKGGGGISPAMRIKATGEFAFVANQANRFQIFPNGDVRPGVGGSYLTPSDKNLKENFETLDNQEILDKLASLPVTSWNYKDDEASRRHIGPMAQDFYATFGLGNDDKTICEMDKNGIAIAAIQGLNQKVESKNAEIATLTESLENQSKQLKNQSDLIEDQFEMIQELTRRMESLESQLAPENK